MTRGRMNMIRVSPAVGVGDCWVCGHGRWWHRLFGWFLRHDYDPIREDTFAERERLDKKYRQGR